MAEPDKRQLGDGSDSFSNAASNLSRVVNTMRQQALASSAGAAAAGAAKTGKAIAGAAKGAAAAGRVHLPLPHGLRVIPCTRFSSALHSFSLLSL